MAGPRKALAWARVSTEDQHERGTSIEQQLREIKERAPARGFEIVGGYEEGASAYQARAKRPRFEEMLAHARRDKLAILVHEYSRFTRAGPEGLILIHQLLEEGVDVVSMTEPQHDPKTSEGVLGEALTHLKNQLYSLDVAKHTVKGCKGNVQSRDPETGWAYKNGGSPLWGYQAKRIPLSDSKGRTRYKVIWLLDERIIAGRPLHEWVREALLMALEGASLAQLVRFCTQHGLPPCRKHWGLSTWNALLQPDVLLKYSGMGIWNVHGKRGKHNPPSSWVCVENSHPAIISDLEAETIHQARLNSGDRAFARGPNRSRTSPYLLSGGVFRCGSCGSNMIGLKQARGFFYVCGSRSYRRGEGCGPGVYVRKEWIEGGLAAGIAKILSVWLDAKRFVPLVNAQIEKLWQGQKGTPANFEAELEAIQAKTEKIRRAIEDGLEDTAWANQRLCELSAERTRLEDLKGRTGSAPRVDERAIRRYAADAHKILTGGEIGERKALFHKLVERVTLAPERVIEITYRVPEPVMVNVVAGVRCDAQKTKPDLVALIFEITGTALVPMKGLGQQSSRVLVAGL